MVQIVTAVKKGAVYRYINGDILRVTETPSAVNKHVRIELVDNKGSGVTIGTTGVVTLDNLELITDVHDLVELTGARDRGNFYA